MANSYFSFKQFTVHQARSAMKVGTDGVLVGAWCGREATLMPNESVRSEESMSERERKEVGCPLRWLDVGTGTGLIALMLAQRFPLAEIDALEPEPAACADAQDNFEASPWKERLHLIAGRLQEYAGQTSLRYDHVVTNPPYFVDALHSPDAARSQARHTVTLPYDELLEGVACVLKEEGTFSLILPPEESRRFRNEATARGWWLQRMTEVHSTGRSGVRRVLMQWGRHPQNGTESGVFDRLLIHGEGGDYTPEYRALTRDFYLRF